MSTARWVPPLPPNWEAKFDQSQRRYFFINHKTKVTTWDDPRYSGQAVQKPPQVSPAHPVQHPQHGVPGQHVQQHLQHVVPGQHVQQHPQHVVPGQHVQQHPQHVVQGQHAQQHTQHLPGQYSQHMQGQHGQHPQQVTGQHPQQVTGQHGQHPQQVTGQHGQHPQQVTGQHPQQVTGQHGQHPQQVTGQHGQHPQQVTGQHAQHPQQVTGQHAQHPQHMQHPGQQSQPRHAYQAQTYTTPKSQMLPCQPQAPAQVQPQAPAPQAPAQAVAWFIEASSLPQREPSIESDEDAELVDLVTVEALQELKAAYPSCSETFIREKLERNFGITRLAAQDIEMAGYSRVAAGSGNLSNLSVEFPDAPVTIIQAILLQFDNDMQKSRKELKDMGYKSSIEKASSPARQSASPSRQTGGTAARPAASSPLHQTTSPTRTAASPTRTAASPTHTTATPARTSVSSARVSADDQRQHEQRPANCYPRYYSLCKRPNMGYGIHLNLNKNELGEVDDNSTAEKAGIRCGDKVIEVNDINTESETHKQIVARIKHNEYGVRLLLVDQKTYDYYKKYYLPIHSDLPEVVRYQPPVQQGRKPVAKPVLVDMVEGIAVHQMLIGEFPQTSQTVIDLALSTCKNDEQKTRTLLKSMEVKDNDHNQRSSSSKSPDRSAQSATATPARTSVSPTRVSADDQRLRQMLIGEFPQTSKTVIDLALSTCKNDEQKARTLLKSMEVKDIDPNQRSSSSKSPERSAQSSKVSSPSHSVSPVTSPGTSVTEHRKKEVTDKLCKEFPNLVRAVVESALKSSHFSEARARNLLKTTFKDNRGKYEVQSSNKNKAQKITSRPAGKSSPTDFLVQASDDLINKLLSTCCIQSADEASSNQQTDTTETQKEDEVEKEDDDEDDSARVTPPITSQAGARAHVYSTMTTSAYRTTPQGPNPELHKGPDKSLLLLEYVQAKGPNPEIHHGPNSSLAHGPRGAQGPDKSLPCGPQAKQNHHTRVNFHETVVM